MQLDYVGTSPIRPHDDQGDDAVIPKTAKVNKIDKSIKKEIHGIPPVPMKSWWVTVAHARRLQIYSWAGGRAAQEGVFGTKLKTWPGSFNCTVAKMGYLAQNYRPGQGL